MNSVYHHDCVIVADRQAQLRREADIHRLAELMRVRRAAVHLRVLGSLGDWMIAGGLRLKARQQAALDSMQMAANGRLKLV